MRRKTAEGRRNLLFKMIGKSSDRGGKLLDKILSNILLRKACLVSAEIFFKTSSTAATSVLRISAFKCSDVGGLLRS